MMKLNRNSFLVYVATFVLLDSSCLTAKAADLVVAADGSGDYLKVQDAIDAVPENKSTRTVIFIKPGTYKEKIRVPSERKKLSLIGESYETTVLTFDDCAGTTSDYASTRVLADDFFAQNLTFQNTIDSRSGIDGGQAAALRVDGDRAMFYRCRIKGFQDTYYTGRNKRSYHDEQVSKATLGRPWGNAARVVYLNCEIDSHIRAAGWSEWSGRDNHKTAYYAEYNNRGPGFQPNNRLPWTHQLTDEEAAEYTRENIFKANSTTAVKLEGDWNPDTGRNTCQLNNSPFLAGRG